MNFVDAQVIHQTEMVIGIGDPRPFDPELPVDSQPLALPRPPLPARGRLYFLTNFVTPLSCASAE